MEVEKLVALSTTCRQQTGDCPFQTWASSRQISWSILLLDSSACLECISAVYIYLGKGGMMVWMWNVPRCLRYLNIWFTVVGVIGGGSPKAYNIIGSMFLEAGFEILNFMPFLVHCHCFMLAVQDVSPYVSAPEPFVPLLWSLTPWYHKPKNQEVI